MSSQAKTLSWPLLSTSSWLTWTVSSMYSSCHDVFWHLRPKAMEHLNIDGKLWNTKINLPQQNSFCLASVTATTVRKLTTNKNTFVLLHWQYYIRGSFSKCSHYIISFPPMGNITWPSHHQHVLKVNFTPIVMTVE